MKNYKACRSRIDAGAGPGTDLNRLYSAITFIKKSRFSPRNFDFAFKTDDPQETDICSETYQGPAPFSEKETQAMKVRLIIIKI